MRIYTYGKVLKIFGFISALILMFSSIAIFFIKDLDKNPNFNLYYIFIPFSIIFFIISILGIRDILVSKVVTTDSYILSINAINTRKLRVEEIQGYKRGRNYVFVYPKKRVFKKKLKFSNYLSNVWEIENWLNSHSHNLDTLEQDREVKEFYKSTEFGFNDHDKERALKKAKKTTRIVNAISVILTITAIIFKDYKIISAIVLICIPLIIISIVFYYKGLIKYADKEEDETTIYPSVFWGIAAPIFLLFLIIIFTIDIFNTYNLWLPLLLLAIVIFILFIVGSKEYQVKSKKSYGKLIMLLLISLMYSHILIIFLNVTLDESKAIIYKSKVLEKNISKGKTTSYSLIFDIKELNVVKEKFNVSSSVYNKVNVKDSVVFLLKEGLLNIPYYNIKVNE